MFYPKSVSRVKIAKKIVLLFLPQYKKFFKKFMALKLSIMIPEKTFWNGEAEEIILPTSSGTIGVLTNHVPLITGLDIGVMAVREKSSANNWISIALMGGFALIKDNTVTILVNDAELGSTIDPASAEKAFNEAKDTLDKIVARSADSSDSGTRKEKIEASLAFKRARARYQVVARPA